MDVELACIADETKPWYSPSANQRPKACSASRVLPVLSIIGSNWLLHLAVLSCTVIGGVDVVEPWLCSRWIPDTQNKRRRSRNYLERYILMQKFYWTLFGVPWSQRFFLIFHRMGELRESRKAANTIREAARDTVRRLTKTSLPQKYFHRFPLLGDLVRQLELLFTASNANTVIAVCLFCVFCLLPLSVFGKSQSNLNLKIFHLSMPADCCRYCSF